MYWYIHIMIFQFIVINMCMLTPGCSLGFLFYELYVAVIGFNIMAQISDYYL